MVTELMRAPFRHYTPYNGCLLEADLKDGIPVEAGKFAFLPFPFGLRRKDKML
jgi:hypothetical protein